MPDIGAVEIRHSLGTWGGVVDGFVDGDVVGDGGHMVCTYLAGNINIIGTEPD